MKRKPVPFATLQRFLIELGFTKIVGKGGYVVNDHAASGCRLVYPAHGDDDKVASFHLVATRKFLDEFGLVERDEFDDRLGRHSVAS